MEVHLHPIGLIHTPFTDPAHTPIQAARSQTSGWVEVFPEYAAGLADVEDFSHLYLLYFLHQAAEVHLLVEPFLDMLDQTPLLDIKPYVPDFDQRENVRAGWYEHRAKP